MNWLLIDTPILGSIVSLNMFYYAICMMASLYYYDQDPSGFYFLVQIRAFVI